MTALKSSIFKHAALEVLRPLSAFVTLEMSEKSAKIRVHKEGLRCHGHPISSHELAISVASLRKLSAWTTCVLDENIHNSVLYARPQWISAAKYKDTDFSLDREALSELYKDDYVSREKKDVIADLENSQGHYIKSAVTPSLRIFDAASQIASLNLGFNSTKRHPLLMRPEAQGFLHQGNTDLKIALSNLLKRESHLSNAYFLNSGSEANDFCLSQFKRMYPNRKKAFAFEGSFHGRTLLALHTTHSPAKREPFELYKGLVDFFAWPENRKPHIEAKEPKEWLNYWSSKTETHTNPIFMEWLKQKDALLTTESCILDRIRKEFQSGNIPFAFITEPMQCEGGDRYTSPRFMRALRSLTRVFDVPLIMDEVQTGFGLGGPFFWHSLFNMQTIDGRQDGPDAITLAKKAQVGVCLSNQKWNHTDTSSPAGWHRGYLQAQAAIEGPEVDDLAPLAFKCLEVFAHDTVPEWINHPRGQAFAFAFDLPTSEIANALIKVRFENGILIYPAGDKTLRFRLMVTTRRRDLYELFVALYGCLETVGKLNHLEMAASLDSFATTLKTILNLDEMDFSHKYTENVSKDQAVLPVSLKEVRAFDSAKWQKVFRTLMRLYPELVTQTNFDLESLKKISTEEIINQYQSTNPSFTWKHLLWELSRKNSFDITIWNSQQIEEHREAIDELQAATYEPARRSSVDQLSKQAKDSRTLSLACIEADGSLAGMCIAVPLDTASDLHFFTAAPAVVDRKDLYSTDLTVDSAHRSNGLGLRLKVEQLIAARLGGFARITSRNRYPEAKAMSRLNQKLGAVVCNISHTDYGGSGTGWYQSLELKKPIQPLMIFRNQSTLLNKMCLSNFVSPAYLNFLEIWRHAIPKAFQHVYLSSGESEALDKWIKTLFAARPQGKVALSFLGDHFGCGTAASQSLGGEASIVTPFEWPRFDANDNLKSISKYLATCDSKTILGIFVEPGGKPRLKDLLELAKSHEIPVIYNETRSMLGVFHSENVFAAEALAPSGFFAYGGNQIAINAVSKPLFISKPLSMISTWDGDEWSLQIFTERLLRFLETNET